jgi:Zn-dependent protease with chaperone function
MKAKRRLKTRSLTAWLLAVAVLAAPIAALTQTRIALRKNKYSEEDDVKVGRQAAGEIERQIRLFRDGQTNDYVQRIGRGLVEAIPGEFQHRSFDYDFKVVEAKEINAFALPGGPMYVNTGMIMAAKDEGEMAGVMAHEIAHVALRHGTAQATKAAPYQTLGALGQIAGAVLGGALGGIVGTGAQVGAGAYLLKFSREYETEADILGAQILARAGYDPRDLAEMFKTIQQQGGGGGPEWLSSHPNPANRYQRIEEEARLLRVSGSRRDSREFATIKSRLGGAYAGGRDSRDPRDDRNSRDPRDSRDDRPELGRDRDRSDTRRNRPEFGAGRVEPPSASYRPFNDNLFRADIPDNWRDLNSQNSIWFAPEGAYGELSGQTVFTHGVNFGAAQTRSRNLQQATNEFIQGLAQGNNALRQRSAPQRGTLAQRNALYTSFSNVSEATGRPEIVEVYTTLLRNGELFYLITVVPQNEAVSYQRAFQRIARSLQIRD